MSNPGVVTLAEGMLGKIKFRVEDNIGEAIHIHFGSVRLDFTLKEFWDITLKLKVIAEKMIGVDGFSYDKYDAIFLSECVDFILKLKQIDFEKVHVGDLLTDTVDDDGKKSIISIMESRIVRALKGDFYEVEERRQTNYWGLDNIGRVKDMNEKITQYGYNPEKMGTYIVLGDDGRYIYDGCHRASIIYHQFGNIEIQIARWRTKDASLQDESVKEVFDQYNKEKSMKEDQRKKRIELTKMLINHDLHGKKILIKGGGKHTRELLKIVDRDNVEIVGILDKKTNIKIDNIPFVRTEDIHKGLADVIFLSSYVYRNEMRKEIEELDTGIQLYDLYQHGIDREFYS